MYTQRFKALSDSGIAVSSIQTMGCSTYRTCDLTQAHVMGVMHVGYNYTRG
jgi:hypothetical protein